MQRYTKNKTVSKIGAANYVEGKCVISKTKKQEGLKEVGPSVNCCPDAKIKTKKSSIY